jgi:hypothetical protein
MMSVESDKLNRGLRPRDEVPQAIRETALFALDDVISQPKAEADQQATAD